MQDNVKHPNHYTAGDIECKDAIKSALGPIFYFGYLWGNIIKYSWRWPRKGIGEDLEKMKQYAEIIKEEGYTEPVIYDTESGCMIPNPIYEVLNCGISVNDADFVKGDHANNA